MKNILIGHRGEPDSWPENSLTGYRQVLQAGARFIETDVQITADGIPVLSHDPSLLKVTGHNLNVTDTPFDKIRTLPAGYPDRFKDQFDHFRIDTLAAFADLLKQWPETRAFVEIKHASVKAFGVEHVVNIMLETLAEVLDQCILISFEYAALEYGANNSSLPVGWVLPEWNNENRKQAEALAPDYLFVNRKRVPAKPEPLWPGPWQWAVYTVNKADEVPAFLDRGFALVETNVIRSLLDEAQVDD